MVRYWIPRIMLYGNGWESAENYLLHTTLLLLEERALSWKYCYKILQGMIFSPSARKFSPFSRQKWSMQKSSKKKTGWKKDLWGGGLIPPFPPLPLFNNFVSLTKVTYSQWGAAIIENLSVKAMRWFISWTFYRTKLQIW
jgi:hypothetical protein